MPLKETALIIGNSLTVIFRVFSTILSSTLEKKPVIYSFFVKLFNSWLSISPSFMFGTNFLIKDSDNLCSPIISIFFKLKLSAKQCEIFAEKNKKNNVLYENKFFNKNLSILF